MQDLQTLATQLQNSLTELDTTSQALQAALDKAKQREQERIHYAQEQERAAKRIQAVIQKMDDDTTQLISDLKLNDEDNGETNNT